jgi:hypothetical protein
MVQRDDLAFDIPGVATSGNASHIAERFSKAHVFELPLVITTLLTASLQHSWESSLSLNVYELSKKENIQSELFRASPSSS